MTVEQFIANVEGYYGDYREAVKPIVVQWLRAQRPTERVLSRLFAELVQVHTSQYRTPPDIAIMKPIMLQIIDEVEHERLAHVTSLQLPDASETVDPEDAHAFMAAIMDAMAGGRDPREDDTVRSYLVRYGVDKQETAYTHRRRRIP